MKKTMKVLAMVLLFALLVGMVGCGRQSSVGLPDPTMDPNNNEGVEEEDNYAPEPEDTPAPAPKDPYEALVVDAASAKNDRIGGYVIRNDKWYTINTLRGSVGSTRDFGFVFNGLNTVDLYVCENNKSSNFLSFGNVPVVSLKPDDKLIMVSDVVFPYMLYRVDFVGYTVSLINNTTSIGSNGVVLYDASRGERIDLPNNFEVSDKAGNIVKDYRNLNYGETYTVSWFEGTKYNERQLVANCSFYKQPDNTDRYELNGKLNKEGYASFDYSVVPSGLYRIIAGSGADIWSVIKVGE